MTPHTRSRSGCWTCRAAGYKCDEKRPYCGRCTRLNIVCEGYGIKLRWKNTAVSPKDSVTGGNHIRSGSPDSVADSVISSARSISTSSSTASLIPNRSQVSSPGFSRGVNLVIATTAPESFPDLSRKDKRLLHYWTEELSSLISVTARDVEPNPYQLHLTGMIYSPGALRSTLLSMAALHLALVKNDADLRFHAYKHQGNAIRQLQVLVQSPHQASAAYALATVLMMQVSTRLFGGASAEPEAANHLVGAKAMLAQRRNGLAMQATSSDARFLFSLLAYHDILSSVSRGSRPFIDHRQYFDAVEGVSSMKGIANVLRTVAGISELQELSKTGVDLDSFETTGYRLATTLEHLGTSLSSIDEEQRSDITLTTEAYRHAAFIYLYRVWRGVGAPSPITLHHVQQCLQNLGQVSVQSPLVSSHVWPLFTAGCEAIDEGQRQFVRLRLTEMFWSLKFPVMKKILADVEAVWEFKDLESIIGGEEGMVRVDCIQVIRKQGGREVSLV